MASFKQEYGARVELISSGSIGNGGTSESATQDNSTDGWLSGWFVLNVTSTTGTAAAGITIYLRSSVDGGTDFSEAKTQIIGTCPSPNGSAKYRAYEVRHLPKHWKAGIANDAGAAITAMLEFMPDRIQK